MNVITPLAGLLKWCILSPGLNTSNNDSVNDIYYKLNLALLESVREAGPGSGPTAVIGVQHLIQVIPTLQLMIAEILRNGGDIKTDLHLQVSLYSRTYLPYGPFRGVVSTSVIN